MESMNQWFARILSEYNITPAEIKRRSGLSESHMSKVLKGERGFGEDAIRKIAKAVGVAPEVFFREVGMCRRYLAIVKADAQNAHLRASPVDNWL
jgi:predicted transcriptional regulator